jgi:hypothetical protein
MSTKGNTIENTFDIVITPLKKEDGYKLSSSNKGSFILKVSVYGEPGDTVDVKITLPPDQANELYDTPNFVLQHSEAGRALTDVDVFRGDVEKKKGKITNQFSITANSKEVTIKDGVFPDESAILIKLHLDYKIDSPLTWEQANSFYGFEYLFTVEIYGSWFGGGAVFGVG